MAEPCAKGPQKATRIDMHFGIDVHFGVDMHFGMDMHFGIDVHVVYV